MANSGTVTASDLVLYSQYNNLRKDVLDTSSGHNHSGSTDCGKLLSHASLENRTRSFFAQVGSANEIDSGIPGYIMSGVSNQTTYTGLFSFPTGIGTPATAGIYFSTKGAVENPGTILFRLGLGHLHDGGLTAHWLLTGSISGSQDGLSTNRYLLQGSINDITTYGTAGSIYCFIFERYASGSPQDTYEGSVSLHGALIHYTADM